VPAASAVSLSKSLIGSKLYVPSFLSTMKAKALAANDDFTSSDNSNNSNTNDKHVSSNSVYLPGKSPELKQKSAAATAVVDFEALKAVSSIDEFNRIYTVPEFGFQNTTEYVSFFTHCLLRILSSVCYMMYTERLCIRSL
jgi:predicted alpha/beta-fold hydrolase